MNHAHAAALAILLALTPHAAAQEPHFPDLKWKEKETDHFMIYAKSTGNDPARKYAEDVWEACQEILPGLEADFAQNEFRTPVGQRERTRLRFATRST